MNFSLFERKRKMSESAILSFGIVCITPVTADQAAWNSFKLRYNKRYKNASEERMRMKNFMDNLKEINEHNELFRAGKSLYQRGLNEFSDMSQDEFHARIKMDT